MEMDLLEEQPLFTSPRINPNFHSFLPEEHYETNLSKSFHFYAYTNEQFYHSELVTLYLPFPFRICWPKVSGKSWNVLWFQVCYKLEAIFSASP